MLEEYTSDVTNPSSPALQSAFYYTLGDDVIAQTRAEDVSGTWTVHDTQYLLYDGHGSTRQLASISGDPTPVITVSGSYSYDAYGVMLSDGSGADAASNADTNLLYAGEQYDSQLDQYYLRARYYNPLNGFFNQVDPYAGNLQDPQSLHKYAYVHNNPVNGIDPTGMFFSIIELVSALNIDLMGRAGDSSRCQPAVSLGRAMNKAMNLINKVDQIWDTLTTLREFTRFTDLTSVEQEVFALGLKGIMNALNTFNVNFSFPTVKIPVPRSLVQKIRRKVGPLWDTPPMQEFLGVAIGALVMTIMGWETTDVAAGYHGVDAIMKIPRLNMFAVVEAKGGEGRLGVPGGKTQMCDDWIEDRVQKAINRNGYSADRALLERYKNGPLFAAIVKSELTGSRPEIAVRVKTYPGIKKNSWGDPFE